MILPYAANLGRMQFSETTAIEIAGVDVVDPPRDRLAKHGEGRVAILRRAEYARPGELHGAVAHTVHRAVAQ